MGENAPIVGKVETFVDPAPFHLEAQGLTLGFYPAGADRLAQLLHMIGQARVSLKLAFYIFDCDDSGALVRDALADAARRGVAVTLILDGFGALADAQFLSPLLAAGGQYRRFQARWSRRYLIRNHQKIVIADGALAMLGGFNIADSYFAPPANDGWTDLAFTVQGPVVARIEAWFTQLEDWTTLDLAQFRALRRSVRDWNSGRGPVQLLIGGPGRGLSSWAQAVGHDLIHGNKLDMMMAYFAPSAHLLRRMHKIAKKGETRLLLPGRSDNGATIGASRLLYSGLLDAGAQIFEFQPCKLHTKLIVLDDVVYLGSANFDMRSLYLNLEIMLRIEDAALATRMRSFIAHHLAAAEAITPQLHKSRASWFNRLRWMGSWLLVAVIDYTVSRRLNLGL